MRSRLKVNEQSNLYFITSSVHCWVPIIFNDHIFGIILESLKFCQQYKGLVIWAYVIMPNHIHAIISHEDFKAIPGIIRDFKRHTSTEISKYLSQLGRYSRLFWIKIFHNQEKNKVWQEGYHPETILSPDFLLTKLNYIHNNPVEKGYVTRPEHWKYSSARNYYLDDHSLIQIHTAIL